MPGKFIYRPRTTEDIQRRQQETASDSPGVVMDRYKQYAPKKGDNWIRILPATWDDAHHWAYDVWVHYGVGPDRATVLCTNRMGGGKCFGCELRMQADRAGDEEESKQLRPRRRAACWLLDRNNEAEGPQIWLMPSSLDDDIQGISIDRTDGGSYYFVDNPYDGYDVTFEKTGERVNTRYNAPTLSRRASSVDETWLDFIGDNPIPACLVWRDYDEVKAMYEGGMGGPAADTAPRQQAPMRGRSGPMAPPARQALQAPPAARGPSGYPAPRQAPQAGPGPVQRRSMAPAQIAPPVDYHQGEEYAVDPNDPGLVYDPNIPADYYDPNVPPTEYDAVEPAPWEDPANYADPNAVQYSNPVPRQAPPARMAPQQLQYPQAVAPRGVPQRRMAAPPQAPVAPQPQRTAYAPPGRAPVPQQQRPGPAANGRGDTTGAGTAAVLRQRFGQRPQ